MNALEEACGRAEKLELELESAKATIAERNDAIGTLKDHAWETEIKRQSFARNTEMLAASLTAAELKLANARGHNAYGCQQCGDCDVRDVILAKPAKDPIQRSPECLSAVYFDCRDSDVLTHEEPDAAVEELVDDAWEGGKTNLENVAKLCPITVKAYSRMKLEDSWVEDRVERMIEDLQEHGFEELGDPDGNHDTWDREELAVIADRLTDAMRVAFSTATVWACEVISSETYEAEAVLDMLHDRGYFS